MGRFVISLAYTTVVVLVVGLGPQVTWAGKKLSQAGIVAGKVTAIANQLRLRPETAKDFTRVSGEYCFFPGSWGGNHTHLAVDPKGTKEDAIEFVNAEPLIKAGLKVEILPRFPGGLGSMKSGQWYFLPAGELEPHHGKKAPVPLLIRAVNLID